MRNLLIVLTGFLIGGGSIVALVLALPGAPRVEKATASSRPAVAMGQQTSASATRPSAMGGTMMTASRRASGSAQLASLTIQHVQRGCHVWSNGSMTATTMRLHLRVGQRLSILDQDVDAHQLLEFAGPSHLRLGGPMTMNHREAIAFSHPGVYHLATKTVEMPGGGMDVETVGPDNSLRLVVTVA